jgi:hypothetical protein
VSGRAAAAACLALVAGCKTIPFPEPAIEGPYGTALRNASRRFVLYDRLETRAFARVVRLTPELVALQAERLSQMRGEPPGEAAARLAKMKAELTGPTFFAVVFTPDRETNDLESKNSHWRVACEVGGVQSLPVSVVRYERPFAAELEALYPYAVDYHVAYRVQFPAETKSEQPSLIVAGPLGKMEFSWTE